MVDRIAESVTEHIGDRRMVREGRRMVIDDRRKVVDLGRRSERVTWV